MSAVNAPVPSALYSPRSRSVFKLDQEHWLIEDDQPVARRHGVTERFNKSSTEQAVQEPVVVAQIAKGPQAGSVGQVESVIVAFGIQAAPPA